MPWISNTPINSEQTLALLSFHIIVSLVSPFILLSFLLLLLFFRWALSFHWALALLVTENCVACAICAVDGFIFSQFRYIYSQGIISCAHWHTTSKKWQHNNLSPDMSAVCTCGRNQNTADQSSSNGCKARKFFLVLIM